MKNFTISKLDISNIPDELYTFFKECSKDNIINNSNIKAMKIGRFGHEAWWVTYIDNKIVSISGMYHFPEISENCWRVMFRTATLKAYRGLAGPVSKKFTHDFNWSKILPLQIEYGKQHGADLFVFTTNSTPKGDANSYKTNKVISRALVQSNMIKLLHKDINLYNTQQNVWQVLI